MGTNPALYDCADHEDYIDMELTSSPENREFEFQMSSTYNHKAETTADELFHNGKLLPLHLLHPSTTAAAATSEIPQNPSQEDQYYYSMPLPCNSNISPSESNKPSSKKLKLIKNSILTQKLKSSRAYLKSLFNKHVCSDDPDNYANCNQGPGNSSNYDIGQRRSFSGAIKRHSPMKCLSSSSSSDSWSAASSSSSSFSFRFNGGHEFDFLRRSSSFNEIEASIDAAIAHCKNSHEEDQKRRDICSI